MTRFIIKIKVKAQEVIVQADVQFSDPPKRVYYFIGLKWLYGFQFGENN